MVQNKKIKFKVDLRSDEFYGMLRKNVEDYLQTNHFDGYATTTVLIKGAFYFICYIFLYLSLILGDYLFPYTLILWFLLGVSGILLGLNISHDAAHGSLFRNNLANKWVYYITFNFLGANAYLWQLRHIESHHLFPNVDHCDADIDDNSVIRLSPYKDLRWFHRYQWLFAPVVYLFYTLHWVFYKDFIILKKKQLANLREIKHPLGEIVLFYAGKLVYLICFLVLPALSPGTSWSEVLTGFLLMHFTASYAFVFGLVPSHFSDLTTFEKVDDNGFLKNSWAVHQVHTSLDYYADKKWSNYIFGGFNAHAAHHLFPTISHVHYPVISKMIASLSRQYKIDYKNVSWFEAVRSHFRFLKIMGITRYQ